MRMRRKKNGDARREACAEYILKDKSEIDEMRKAGKLPCRLEIGCGKGDFAVCASQKYQSEPYIAMELISDVALCALEKAKAAGCENLKFIIGNAKNLGQWFEPGDIKVLYLNFSDPWPKKGHTKRRLTYRGFLEIYRSLLSPDGMICFKTDNQALFDFSLEEFEAAGFALSELTRDLHNSPYNSDNIETEYERNFSAKGFTICRVVARPKAASG